MTRKNLFGNILGLRHIYNSKLTTTSMGFSAITNGNLIRRVFTPDYQISSRSWHNFFVFFLMAAILNFWQAI